MGDIISSFASGFVSAIDKLFGSPLEFLSGKSCSSVCGPTWDFICYIENFCVSNLLKMGMVLVLCYFVLLFFYVLHKIGIYRCICRGLCKMTWKCLASCIYTWEYCCIFMCVKLGNLKRTNRRHHRRRDDPEDEEFDDGGRHWHRSPSHSSYVHENVETRSSRRAPRRWRRSYRSTHMRKALKPKSHGIRVKSSRKSNEVNHDFGVHGSSKFAHRRRK